MNCRGWPRSVVAEAPHRINEVIAACDGKQS
jgi:hypothetical protein